MLRCCRFQWVWETEKKGSAASLSSVASFSATEKLRRSRWLTFRAMTDFTLKSHSVCESHLSIFCGCKLDRHQSGSVGVLGDFAFGFIRIGVNDIEISGTAS